LSATIRGARSNELGLISAFVARLQERPESRIPYFDELPDQITAEIASWGSDWPLRCRVAERDTQIVGYVGVEVDPELGRAWIYGPFAEDAAWDELADPLLQEAIALTGVEDLELLGDDAHVRLAALAAQHGFPRGRRSFGLEIERHVVEQLPHTAVPRLNPSQQAAFASLHEALFPRTYYSGIQLAEQHGRGEAIVLTLLEDGDVLGYAVGRGKEGEAAYVDFLGVAEHARGRGLGRRLTTAVCNALLEDERRSKVALTVYEDNVAALALYDRLGFERVASMVGYRRRP
jgi:ribosomal protein S18 acetylase RimI-like enzyme